MSDDAGEIGRDYDNRPDGDEFSRAVSRIAIAQICVSVGFRSCQRSALVTLSNVVAWYVSNLGKAAHFYANLSGRTDCNVFDIIQGLEDLRTTEGFTNASDIYRCPVRSGVVKEIIEYVCAGEEVPFAFPVPCFPVVRYRKQVPSFAQIGETPAGKHIPDWLPALPDPHTYVHTPVYNERVANVRACKIEHARQQRKAERSLLNLQQRLACNGSAGTVPRGFCEVRKGKQVAGVNPFLASPLACGEKGVAEIVAPKEDGTAGKETSVLEIFAPVIEAAKSGSLGHGTVEKRILPNKRPSVYFNLGVDKKTMAAPLSSNALGVRMDSWFLRDDERDEKKWRAEMIPKQAMENPEELIQKFFGGTVTPDSSWIFNLRTVRSCLSPSLIMIHHVDFRDIPSPEVVEAWISSKDSPPNRISNPWKDTN